jgi:23S rRNA (uracil1939-C5)-methyltransferase
MVERLDIKGLGRRGDGIADTPAGPLYVPYTLPGETAEVDVWPGHPDRRRLVRVDVASPERIAPICPHFGTCGGCALQHWDAARYRDWKRGLVLEALAWASMMLRSTRSSMRMARGAAARVSRPRGQRDVLEVGFAALRAHQLSRSIAARCWRLRSIKPSRRRGLWPRFWSLPASRSTSR